MRRTFGSPAPGEAPRELLATEGEVFECCGDPSGRRYWGEWLSSPDEPEAVLIKLLVTHATLERLHEARDLMREAIGGGHTTFAREAKETIEEVERRVTEAFKAFPAGSAHDRVALIAASPKTRPLVPASLRAFLEASGRAEKPDPAPSFVAALATDVNVPKRKGGRPPAADWVALEVALNEEIDLVGLPRRDGVPGWRTIADAVKWIEKRTGDDNPGKTALKENVGAMIRRATTARKSRKPVSV
jgi:hypothetical protein